MSICNIPGLLKRFIDKQKTTVPFRVYFTFIDIRIHGDSKSRNLCPLTRHPYLFYHSFVIEVLYWMSTLLYS